MATAPSSPLQKSERDARPAPVAGPGPRSAALGIVCAVAAEFLIQVAVSAAAALALSIARAGGMVDRATYAALAGSSFTFLVPIQIARILIMGAWYARKRPRADTTRAEGSRGAVDIALAVIFLALFGIWFQFFISLVLACVLPAVPSLEHAYSETVTSLEIAAPGMVAVASSIALAPIGEELVFRGVVFEYALDMLRARGKGPTMHPRASRGQLIANVVQAASFALLHLDPVQSAYTFVMGLALGRVRLRTGSLFYPMVLHAAINASAYAVAPCTGRVPAGFILFAISLAMAGVAVLRERVGIHAAAHTGSLETENKSEGAAHRTESN